MVVPIGILLVAGAAVWSAGTRLSRDADALANSSVLGRVFIGALLLGVATSLPEIATTVTAGAVGNSGLATGNLLGGVAAQVVVLALADAVHSDRRLTSGSLELDRARPARRLAGAASGNTGRRHPGRRLAGGSGRRRAGGVDASGGSVRRRRPRRHHHLVARGEHRFRLSSDRVVRHGRGQHRRHQRPGGGTTGGGRRRLSRRSAPRSGRARDVFLAALAAVLTCVYLAGLLLRGKRTVLRIGYDSAAVVLVYVAGLAVVAAMG